MPTIKYEKRAVAYVDVLGFSELVDQSKKGAEARKKLGDLVDKLANAVPCFDRHVGANVPKNHIPDHIYISDCIVLSVILDDKADKTYDGLSILVMRVIQLVQWFLEAGYLVRGGVAIGPVWHCDNNIVGPAYQEAYKLEQGVAVMPRVILSKDAAQRWNAKKASWHVNSRMCMQDADGQLIVNGLHEGYIAKGQAYDDVYQCYLDSVAKKLSSKMSVSARAKWLWFREFLESEIKFLGLTCK